MNSKFKRGLLFLTLSAIFGLAGCSGSKEEHIVLRCSSWGDSVAETKIVQAAADEFKKKYPNVEVQMDRVPFGDYITKLLTRISAGIPPDVMEVNCDQLAAFASKGVFADLTPFVSKDPSVSLKDFYPEAVQEYTVDGLLTAIPRNIAPIAVVYYNKKEFDAAGLPYPKDDWDYLQFLETAKKLTKKDAKGNVVQFGFVDDWPMWDCWIFAFGGSLVDDARKPTRCVVDSPEGIAGVQFRLDLVYKYGVTPGPAYSSAMGGLGNSDLFMNGNVAMFQSGIWQTPTFRQITNFDWDVVEFPKGPNGHRGFTMDEAGYGILKTCKHPDLAYELVKFLAAEEGQKHIAATGLSMPAMRSISHSKDFLDGQKPVHKAFLADAVKDGHFMSFDPNVLEWTQRVGSFLDRAFNGSESAEVALKKAAKEVNEKFFKKP